MPVPPDPQGRFERAFALGDLDPFDFTLARDLGMTVEAMRDALSNREYLQWRAYYVWRAAKEKLEATLTE